MQILAVSASMVAKIPAESAVLTAIRWVKTATVLQTADPVSSPQTLSLSSAQ
jgi:hypothetical protein